MKRAWWLPLVAVAALLACEEDEKKPGGSGTPSPALDNLWPDADGNQWVFDLTIQTRGGDSETFLFPTEEDVPPSPSFEDLLVHVQSDDFGDAAQTDNGFMDLIFNGQTTTDSGATGQNLEAVLREPGGTDKREPHVPDALLRWLAAVRPDLRERIEAAAPHLDLSAKRALAEPLFLGSAAYRRTNEFIAYLNDLDTEARWQLLTADLRPGAEWEIQPVPVISEDVVLRGRILGTRTESTPLGDLPKTLEVLYVVDVGVSEAMDTDGNTLGYFRSLIYAIMRFAPEVGPVYLRERSSVSVGRGEEGLVFSEGEEEWECILDSFTPSTPTQPGR